MHSDPFKVEFRKIQNMIFRMKSKMSIVVAMSTVLMKVNNTQFMNNKVNKINITN